MSAAPNPHERASPNPLASPCARLVCLRPPPAPTHHTTLLTAYPPYPHLAEHNPAVFGGYKGCVGENGLLPCAQDGFEGMDAMT